MASKITIHKNKVITFYPGTLAGAGWYVVLGVWLG
jgi:hypothetical protein